MGSSEISSWVSSAAAMLASRLCRRASSSSFMSVTRCGPAGLPDLGERNPEILTWAEFLAPLLPAGRGAGEGAPSGWWP